MTDYETIERGHFADPDKRTGIYAPKVINGRCSHGKTWAEDCPECALVSARQIVEHWGLSVDEARRVIAAAEQQGKAT